ncbi:LOW QUALITY PROTEIN: uncharacterized protein LOC131955042, partial [Physella acuta]|uniref:LOW QUALITY PROTEIN: uncharacterized protein LOC131955042 n=1 Tax=Physella acuta TaxID=109671 RepID=UPI0027DBC764
IPHKKSSNRMDRLKQWREERKKKMEEEKRNSKKPMFKVSHMEYQGEASLYKKEKPVQAKAKPVIQTVTKQEVPSTRMTRSSAKETAPSKKAMLEKKSVKETATNKNVPSKKTSPVRSSSQKKEKAQKASNLYSKLTVSAAAKAKGANDKPKEFLRAKPHKVAKVAKKEVSNENLTGSKNIKITIDVKVEATNSSKRKKSINRSKSSGSKCRYRKTPAVRRSRSSAKRLATPRRSKRIISALKKETGEDVPDKTEDEESFADSLDNSETPVRKNDHQQSGNVDDISFSDDEVAEKSINNLSKNDAFDNKENLVNRIKSSSSDTKRKSNYSPSTAVNPNMESTPKTIMSPLNPQIDQDSGLALKESDLTPYSKLLDQKLKSTTKRRSRRLDFSPAKKASVEHTPTKYLSNSETGDTEDTQILFELNSTPSKRVKYSSVKQGDDIDNDNQIYLDSEVDKKSVSSVSKRKSTRLAALTAESSEESTSKSPKTRKSMRRSINYGRRSILKRRSRSVVVSVSDEGTTSNVDENTITEVHLTNENHPRLDVSLNRSTENRRSTRKSQVIHVSDEGTTLVPESHTVYQVKKAAVSEAPTRALQELSVEKMGGEGETSFIEVPMDESDSCEVSIHQASTSSGDKTQSTQPFSPHTLNTSCTDASSQNSPGPSAEPVSSPDKNQELTNSPAAVTPRSLRQRRGRSIAPNIFKTPGQPLSAIKAKSEKRRRKTEYTPSKSPEEMVEILKKSPMIEMNRRKSRFAAKSPELIFPDVSKFDLMLTEVTQLENMNTGDKPAEITISNDTDGQVSNEAIQESSYKMERVKYFRDLVKVETKRLNDLCQEWTETISNTADLGEDSEGQIRSTVGKAQLLIDQRFKQFIGLVDNCEFDLGEKETTPTDLQGFWEMIYFQVEDVNQMFSRLTELQNNDWQVKLTPVKNVPKKRPAVKVSKSKVKSNFAAFRQEMMNRKKEVTSDKNIENESKDDSESVKVFDAGFFKVSSPVKLQSGKSTPCNTPKKEQVEEVAVTPPKDAAANQQNSPFCNIENVAMATPHNRLLSVKRNSYVPAIPSPLLNDITGIKTKK